MKNIYKLILLILASLVFFTNCGTIISISTDSEDPYMTVGTPEYDRYTQNLLGTWEVISMEQFGEDSLASLYDKITLTISHNPTAFVMEFYPKQSIVDKRTKDWKAKDASFKVNSYKRVISWGDWEVGEKGFLYDEDFISFAGESPSTNLVITGDGKTFDGFAGWEMMVSSIIGLNYWPERYLVQLIGPDTLRLYSYEKKGILHWNRDIVYTDIYLKKVR